MGVLSRSGTAVGSVEGTAVPTTREEARVGLVLRRLRTFPAVWPVRRGRGRSRADADQAAGGLHGPAVLVVRGFSRLSLSGPAARPGARFRYKPGRGLSGAARPAARHHDRRRGLPPRRGAGG